MNRLCTALDIEQKDLQQRFLHNLEFLGEEVLLLTKVDGHSDANLPLPDNVGLVISSSENPNRLQAHIPLITVGDVVPTGDLVNHITHMQMPLRDHSLIDAIHRAGEYREQQNFEWPGVVKSAQMFPQLVGDCPSMREVKGLMAKVCEKEATVMITGASGTGKEVVARSIHEASPRRQGPFVPVNCGAIPSELIESELFGYEKGAFTGAVSSKLGRFELAQGGTIFLDEVGDLPLLLQVKLLRVIQERSFERVGGTETIQSDVRIISATHCDLEAMITEGAFREDLFYRLNLFPIDLPLLSARGNDLEMLLNKFQVDIEKETGELTRLSDSVIKILEKYSWPGNVRELRNLIERMTIQHPNMLLQAEHLPEKILRYQSQPLSRPNMAPDVRVQTPAMQAGVEASEVSLLPINGLDLKEYMTRLEKSLIQQALDDTESVVARAADRLHIRRTTLVEKMRKYGMQRVVSH
ncbi:MAG: sigma-54-dependent Fis family transcriptional regulator [Pseudomonadales bacterium]|nr:sigma-54-dependent Fis family transcriptional regulator [Pseudomonadales bacterium]